MSCHHSLQLSVLKGLQVVWFLTLLGCFGFGLILIKTSSCSINAVIHWGSTSTSSLMSNINTRGKQPCGAHTIKTHLQQSMRFLMPPIDQHLPNPREKKVVFYTTHLQTNVLAVAIKKGKFTTIFNPQKLLGNFHQELSDLLDHHHKPRRHLYFETWTALLLWVGVLSRNDSDRVWNWSCNQRSV